MEFLDPKTCTVYKKYQLEMKIVIKNLTMYYIKVIRKKRAETTYEKMQYGVKFL